VPFCFDISQVIASIVAQFEPLGQHNTVVFAANGVQVEVVGQQKDDGRPGFPHEAKLASLQVPALSKILYADGDALEVARQTAARSRFLDICLMLPPIVGVVVSSQIQPLLQSRYSSQAVARLCVFYFARYAACTPISRNSMELKAYSKCFEEVWDSAI
jgi:hypothetical protein